MIAHESMLEMILEAMEIEIGLAKTIAINRGAKAFYFYPNRFPDNMPAVKKSGDLPYHAIAFIDLCVDGHVRIV